MKRINLCTNERVERAEFFALIVYSLAVIVVFSIAVYARLGQTEENKEAGETATVAEEKASAAK